MYYGVAQVCSDACRYFMMTKTPFFFETGLDLKQGDPRSPLMFNLVARVYFYKGP